MTQTREEQEAAYDLLLQEEQQLPPAIDNIMQEIAPLEKQISSLRSQAQELDFSISELPPQTYSKQCTCAFLCMGKTCSEIPVPNPEIGKLVKQRNDLVRQSNELQKQVDEKAKQLTVLGERQIEVKTQLNELRGQLMPETLMSLTQFKTILPTISKYLPYILIGGGALSIIVVAIIKRRQDGGGKKRKKRS